MRKLAFVYTLMRFPMVLAASSNPSLLTVRVTTSTATGLLRRKMKKRLVTQVSISVKIFQFIYRIYLRNFKGEKIQCGSKIRLEHASTRRNLHSHNFKAPLTKSHDEVSAFGVAGEGDSFDSWVLECLEDMQCTAAGQCEDGGYWKRGSLVRLRNAITGTYLLTSNQKRFDDSNCPQCPINGQQEVSAASKVDEKTTWFAEEGVYVI